MNQIIGRSARYKSHADLPEDERTVDVYRYKSVYPKSPLPFQKPKTSIDEYLMDLSRRKSKLNKGFTSAWMETPQN
jgi:hypothetical protein